MNCIAKMTTKLRPVIYKVVRHSTRPNSHDKMTADRL